MGDVIYLDPANAYTMNMLKQSIAFMKSKNVGGKFDGAIEKESNVLRSFFDDVLGRSEAAEITEAA